MKLAAPKSDDVTKGCNDWSETTGLDAVRSLTTLEHAGTIVRQRYAVKEYFPISAFYAAYRSGNFFFVLTAAACRTAADVSIAQCVRFVRHSHQEADPPQQPVSKKASSQGDSNEALRVLLTQRLARERLYRPVRTQRRRATAGQRHQHTGRASGNTGARRTSSRDACA